MKFGDTETMKNLPISLHYYSGTADYFIIEYDGVDTMYGRVRFSVYPFNNEFRIFKLSELKTNPYMKLNFSWEVI